MALFLSMGIILPAKSLSVGVIEGSGEQLDSVLAPPADKAPILPEYDTEPENIAPNMRSSCELKDSYLPGSLSGNRLPTFDSASDAFEACKTEEDCLGMTFSPTSGKWSLRSSSEPKDSTTKEVSLTKECVLALGLPRFTLEGRRHCYDAKQKEFETLEDASTACENNATCAGIWDDKCDGTHFWTCEKQRDWDEFSGNRKSFSCILRKNLDVQNRFNPDVMLGDQPPEDRLNQVEVEKETKNSCAPSCTKCKPLVDLATDYWCLQQCNKQPVDCPKHLCNCF